MSSSQKPYAVIRPSIMFTGLVSGLGYVRTVVSLEEALAMRVSIDLPYTDLVLGESIAVNGACLTLESFEMGCGTFFISQETLSRTAFGSLKTGQCVNLEQSLRMGDRMGGHWVQGHIDTVGHILALYPDGDSYRLKVGMPVSFSRYLIEKGSITLDGISLTINALGVTQTEAWVDIQIIPHTWVNTHLHTLAVGARMHIEVDVLAKYVEKLFRND